MHTGRSFNLYPMTDLTVEEKVLRPAIDSQNARKQERFFASHLLAGC
jgi:hypothetical protein